MGPIEVKIKKLREDAVIPRYQTEGAAGFDFIAAMDYMITIRPGSWAVIPFGIAMEIPVGYELCIRSRSGLAFRNQVVAYHGLIDCDYRGELSVMLFNGGVDTYKVNPGDRVAQGVLREYVKAVFIESDELSSTARGENGFGSTGKR